MIRTHLTELLMVKLLAATTPTVCWPAYAAPKLGGITTNVFRTQ